MTDDREVCKDAEVYMPEVSHIYHCNREKDCQDKTYIPGIVYTEGKNKGKPFPLCAREMRRSANCLEEKATK